MDFKLNVILSYSIGLAVIISWVRFKNLNPAYYPFIFILWLGLINETVSTLMINNKYSNAPNFNIYSLIEIILISWQFKKWRLFDNNKTLFYVILVGSLLFWIVEVFILGSIHSFNSYFIIGSSFAIVLMSISMVNYLLSRVQTSLLKNSIFLICLGFIFYFTYAILVEAFWVYGLTENEVFTTNIYTILIYVNLFANLLYALAVLWIPSKPKFILPF